MRQALAIVVSFAALGLTACSLIYNPDNIGKGKGDGGIDAKQLDAPPDMEIILDANPAALELDGLEPSVVVEGTGDRGSRPETLVIHGHQMVVGASVAITSGSGSDAIDPMIDVLDGGSATVADDGNTIAVTIVAHVDGTLAAQAMRDLTVTVTQLVSSDGSATVSKQLDWKEAGLAELQSGSGAGSNITLTGTEQFSVVDIENGTVSTSGASRVIVQSTSSLTITPAIDVSASGGTAGPGGGAGGAAGTNGAGLSPGMSAGAAAGAGGGGFGVTGAPGQASGSTNGGGAGSAVGDPLITSYATNRSSGGAGATGIGGGGGGTIELTAAGPLMVSAVKSVGAAGAKGTGLGASGGGGGGTGGAIVVRGATATFGALTVTGGGGGQGAGTLGGGDGGGGGDGRVRIDGANVDPASLGADLHRGLSFDTATPSIVKQSVPMFTIDGSPGDTFDMHVLDATGAPIGGMDVFTIGFGASTQVVAMPIFPVAQAYRVCLTPQGGNVATDESTNCIHVAFVPSTAP